ncbi:MAG: S9 family peptidase [bacterium]|nr:S9 family peptidase [bacterium]
MRKKHLCGLRRVVCTSLLIIVAVAPAAVCAGDESHPFNVHDLVAMDRISDPQVSPDGQNVAFVLRTTDLEANKGRTDLWMVSPEGGPSVRLTTHEAPDGQPRWAPDGKSLFFLSGRSGSSQVWQLPLTGGEARQVTDLPLDVGGFVLSPDGRKLAVFIEVFADCESVDCTAQRLKKQEKQKTTGRLYDRLFIRHWDTWDDGRRSQLFVVPVAGGEPVHVSKGLDADIPAITWGGPEEITFTPDGRSLVFAARAVGREEAWSVDFDLYLVPADGSAAPVCLTEDHEAWDTQPVFSPDGTILAYLAMDRPGYEADRLSIVLQEWPEGKRRVLTENWDRSAGAILFSQDGKTIYTTADDLGQVGLFAIKVSNGKVRPVFRDGRVRSPGLLPDGRMIFGRDHLRSPVDLYVLDADGKDAKQITHFNQDRLAAARMGEPEQFTFKGWNDETVHAYVVKPADFDPSGRYPVAFLIHGGPQGSFGDDFHYRWNPQAYTGAGYAAVMVDFHGSVGYGQAFSDSIRGDWGGKPLEDLQKGLAAAIERYPWLDGDRVCALGASYGGYMINWIAGNWPDRFRCLVNHDGNLDERMAYFDTEELWFPEWDHEGTPWTNPEGYEKHNPVNFVEHWKTPMLVIHGALDFRVVDTQGISTFTALQRRGIPSQLLYFPDENHWVQKPANSIQWHETVLAWLERWLHDGKDEK